VDPGSELLDFATETHWEEPEGPAVAVGPASGTESADAAEDDGECHAA
jgi:hypothetical protein